MCRAAELTRLAPGTAAAAAAAATAAPKASGGYYRFASFPVGLLTDGVIHGPSHISNLKLFTGRKKSSLKPS